MTVEEFIADFYARHDKIAELQFSTIVQGRMMLRQAGLDSIEQNMNVQQASHNYDVNRVSSALHSAYKNNLPYSATLNTHHGSLSEETKALLAQRGGPSYHHVAQTKPPKLRNQRRNHGRKQCASSIELKNNAGNDNNTHHPPNPKTAEPHLFYH